MLFRESPTRTGRPDAADPLEATKQLEVLIRGLAEADPGVEADPLLRDSCGNGCLEAFLEEPCDLIDDVVVSRLDLHRARLPLHVHETNVRFRVRDDPGQQRIATERGDVVDEHDSELERPSGDLGLRCVDRHGKPRQAFEDRHDPPQLLVERHRLRSGACRLAPHIDERRTFAQQAFRGRDGEGRVGVLAPVREAVRRDVDDADHRRAGPTLC